MTRRSIVALCLGAVLLGNPSTMLTATGAAAKKAADDSTIEHVLNRLAFGPAPGDVARVREMGLDAYIDQQLHPERLPDALIRVRLAGFQTLTMSTRDLAERYYIPFEQLRREVRAQQAKNDTNANTNQMQDDKKEEQSPRTEMQKALANMSPEERERARAMREQSQQVMGELAEQKLLRAVYSDRQLEEVLVDFWFNHFNVFAGKGPTRVYLTEYERDVIRPHVFGKFRDLLGATAHSPAMLFYLDNWQSSDPDAPDPRMMRRNERDGSFRARRFPQRDGMSDEQRQARLAALQARMPRGLNENYGRELLELHTLGVDGGYTQQDIVSVAKCFTGWTIQEPRRGGEFRFDDRRHVKGPKVVLGKTIDKGGVQDGEAVLDLLAAHPSTAKFIATKLARRFVADVPPPALVDRAAATFRSTHGDLRAVVRTILTSPEFVSADAMHAKVKTPFEFVASALRATGAQIDDATGLVRNLQNMGMPLYMAQPPTGYIDRADVWVNTGALLNRMNFAVELVNNRVRGVRIDRGGDVTQVAANTLGSPEFQRR